MLTFDLCRSIHTEYDDDGFLLIGHDGYGEKKSGIHPGEAHWHGGIFFRPRAPDTDSKGNPKLGCNVWQTWEGDVNHIIPASDPRAVPKLPRMVEGSAGLYGDTGKPQLPFCEFDGLSGSFTLYIPYSFSGTPQIAHKAMTISINVLEEQGGEPRLQIVHGEGNCISLHNDGSVNLVSKGKTCSISLNADGKVVVNGNTTVQGAVLMGNPSTAQPVALATLLQTYLTLLEAAIAAGIGAIPTGAPGVTAFNSAVAAISANKAAIAALLTKAA